MSEKIDLETYNAIYNRKFLKEEIIDCIQAIKSKKVAEEFVNGLNKFLHVENNIAEGYSWEDIDNFIYSMEEPPVNRFGLMVLLVHNLKYNNK